MKNNPKDLIEAVKEVLSFKELNILIQYGPHRFHHGIGQNIRNDWGLWDRKSQLHKWFNSIGVYHADDMSSLIFTSVYRILMHEKVGLAGQIEKIKKHWANFGVLV